MGTLIAILAQNAVPIFADVDPLTVEITPETVARKITPRTKAIILVHLAGLPADSRGIVRLARSRGIAVVEDMAQSYLCKQGSRYAGTLGDIGCWSLNESKHIGAGDGGILLTNRREPGAPGGPFRRQMLRPRRSRHPALLRAVQLPAQHPRGRSLPGAAQESPARLRGPKPLGTLPGPRTGAD